MAVKSNLGYISCTWRPTQPIVYILTFKTQNYKFLNVHIRFVLNIGLHVICTGSLHHVLHYYETLHVSDFKHHVVRRSAEEGGKHTRHIKVAMLGR